jgi:tRNA(Arg) A34 adenosine deaminase TadA
MNARKTRSKQRQEITAVIYDKRGRILSIGKNSYLKSHPYQAKLATEQGEENKIFLHAEIHAIVKCKELDKAHKIMIFRFNRDGNPVLAAPCRICASAIKLTNIKYIEHT